VVNERGVTGSGGRTVGVRELDYLSLALKPPMVGCYFQEKMEQSPTMALVGVL
jgi:hypothetical protein